MPEKTASESSANRRNQASLLSLLSNLYSTPAPFPPLHCRIIFRATFPTPKSCLVCQMGAQSEFRVSSVANKLVPSNQDLKPFDRHKVKQVKGGCGRSFPSLQRRTTLRFGEIKQTVTAPSPISPRLLRKHRGSFPGVRAHTTPASVYFPSQTLLLFPEPNPPFGSRSDTNSDVSPFNKPLQPLPSPTILKAKTITAQNREKEKSLLLRRTARPRAKVPHRIPNARRRGSAAPDGGGPGGGGSHVFRLLRTRQPKQKGGLPSPAPPT